MIFALGEQAEALLQSSAHEYMDTMETIKVLARIKRNSQLAAYAHFRAAERMSHLHLWLGIPTALISVGLGSVLVADLKETIPAAIKWGAGVLSLVAALLSTLQTIFNPKVGKSRHREIANNYLAINKKAEIAIAAYRDRLVDLQQLSATLIELNAEYEAVGSSSQDYPTNDRDRQHARHKVRGFEARREQEPTAAVWVPTSER
ncbi:SLATT domain-containing protein [Shewanella sp. GXUN23E]|uniref:SLATT domain-containing protein n=1 Tax=Shewanella sp. GXUN23E TaxID=3422498 RepID=UPI003D7DA30E